MSEEKEEFLYYSNQNCPREDCIYHINKTERDVLFYWTRYCKCGEEDRCKNYEVVENK